MSLLLLFKASLPVVEQKAFRFRVVGGSVAAPLNDPFS